MIALELELRPCTGYWELNLVFGIEVKRAPIFQARALSSEPRRARACPNYPRACFEPELFTNKNAKIRV